MRRSYAASFDDPSTADDFLVQGDGASFDLRDGALIFDATVPKRGATLWLRREFFGDIHVRYVATAVEPILGNALNFMFHARPMDDTPIYDSPLSGEYAQYKQNARMYVTTFTGDYEHEEGTATGRVRIRKNPGFHLLAHTNEVKAQGNTRYRIDIVKRGPHIVYAVDERVVHHVIDGEDPSTVYRMTGERGAGEAIPTEVETGPPHDGGALGFRLWKTAMRVDTFEVYALEA